MAKTIDERAQLRRQALQFLVHSFLYYRLDEPVVTDEWFDRLTEDLRELRARLPDAEMPHAKIVESALGPEASGFQIRRYPPDVVTAAFKLLYAMTDPGVEFREFVERRGYRLEEED